MEKTADIVMHSYANNREKIIFQRFPHKAGGRSFPYPILYREPDVDYICFTDDERVHSSAWNIQVVDSLTETNLEPYLEQYAVRWELQPDQIQMGELLSGTGEGMLLGELADANIVTVPALEALPLVRLEPDRIIPTADAEGNYIYRGNPVYSGGRYNGRPLLLTIGVPVSNQIGTIDRCLFHIKPLLEQLDAELLVIDTGSTDGTVEVCQRYGARIISHPWDGNMSAARNEGIYHALGEWYMSIDDDEWFEDVEDILRFFKEGFYRNYSLASYIQRNYMDSAGMVYEDTHTPRMARITPNLHFEGRIHDALLTDPVPDTIFVLHSYAHHYGFVSDDFEKVRQKAMRNVPILLQDVFEYPKNLRYLFQLANEYRNLRCGETAIGLFAQTMAMAMETGDQYREKNSMVMLCACLLDMNDKRLFQWAENIGQGLSLTLPEQAFLAWSQEMLGFRMDMPAEQVLCYYCRYKELLQQHQKNPTSGQSQTYYGLSAVEHEIYIMDARAVAFLSYLAVKEEKNALEILDGFSMDRITLRIHTEVLTEGLAAEDTVYEAVSRKLTAEQWEEWSGDILDAFAAGLTRNSIYRRQLRRLPDLLARMSVPVICSWFEHSAAVMQGEAGERLFLYAMDCGAEGCTVQELCFCAMVLKEAYMKKRQEENSREIFHYYLFIHAVFAEKYYHPELLADDKCQAIPPDNRAAYRMAVALADGRASQENVTLLKQALSIFPLFHEEIRGILDTLNMIG